LFVRKKQEKKMWGRGTSTGGLLQNLRTLGKENPLEGKFELPGRHAPILGKKETRGKRTETKQKI